jgi:predicted phosphodiesterase
MRRLLRWMLPSMTTLAALAACGPGNVLADYPPPALGDIGLHNSPTYVARNLLVPGQVMLEHPRLGQPAVRLAGDAVDVGWIAPGLGSAATTAALTIDSDPGTVVALTGDCDADGVCHATLPPAVTALLPVGLHGLCVGVPSGSGATDCSPNALAIVPEVHDPLTIIHVSDAHVGSDDNLGTWERVVAAVNAIDPPPDVVIFTGDGADVGTPVQHAQFTAVLSQLTVPVFAVTGNHDYDARGIDGWLVDVNPELDFQAVVGPLQLVGVSSGQDLDDGHHDTTISESSGPDASQLAWLATVLVDGALPTVAFFHHPIYNGLFATIGPESRDQLKALVTRPFVRAVLCGHTHISAVFDADGDSRGLSTSSDDVPSRRWPLHYIASRSTRGAGGFAVLHVGTKRVDYTWLELP